MAWPSVAQAIRMTASYIALRLFGEARPLLLDVSANQGLPRTHAALRLGTTLGKSDGLRTGVCWYSNTFEPALAAHNLEVFGVVLLAGI